MPFDSKKFVMVNRQNRPVTVYDRNKRQVRVAPISYVSVHGQWDKSATYVLTDAHFARDVGTMGPLYLMDRKEAEKLMGEWFPGADAVHSNAPGTVDTTATPVGMSASQQSEQQRKSRPPGVGAAPAAAAAATAVAAPLSEDPAEMAKYYTLVAEGMSEDEARATVWPSEDDGGAEVELKTQAELDGMKMPAVRAYASNWEIKGNSKQALIDQLLEQDCVAPVE